jgi:hypothetical protein
MHVIGVLVGITAPLSLQPLALLKKSNVLGLKETINGRSPVPVCLLLCESFICRCESEIVSIVDGGDSFTGFNVLRISLFFLELLARSCHFEVLFPLYTTTKVLSVTPHSKILNEMRNTPL